MSGSRPQGRHSHTAVTHEKKMYIYGGVNDEDEYLGDLWIVAKQPGCAGLVSCSCEWKPANQPRRRRSEQPTGGLSYLAVPLEILTRSMPCLYAHPRLTSGSLVLEVRLEPLGFLRLIQLTTSLWLCREGSNTSHLPGYSSRQRSENCIICVEDDGDRRFREKTTVFWVYRSVCYD